MITEQKIRSQQRKVYDLLSAPNPDGLTRMQIAKCLGIERASICRRVAELRDRGLGWIVSRGLDPTTGERAEFLTCNRGVAERAEAKQAERTDKEMTGRLF